MEFSFGDFFSRQSLFCWHYQLLQQCCGNERNWSYTVRWLPLELVWTLDACWNPHTLTIETNFSFSKLFFSFGISTHFIVTRTLFVFHALPRYPHSDHFVFLAHPAQIWDALFENENKKPTTTCQVKKNSNSPEWCDLLVLKGRMFALFFCFKECYTGAHLPTATRRIIPVPSHFCLKFLEN